jgi:tetratricopeptide (TPR) repeat protein
MTMDIRTTTTGWRTPRALVMAAVLAATTYAPTAMAQDIDRAIGAFQNAKYDEAASLFYAILRFEEDKGVIAEAEYGLAASFQKQKLFLAALKYFEDIIQVGADHPYFDKAVEGVLEVAETLQDDLKSPAIIDKMYDENITAIEKMSPEIRQRMHYIIGKHAFNRGSVNDARDFLKTVKEGNPSYAPAQYLLGLIRLGVGRADSPKPNYRSAIQHFENVRTTIPLGTSDERLRVLRDLATLGIGRINYEMAYQLDDGDPERKKGLDRAVFEYRNIPRFSEAWSDALFERAWAHTVNNEYGKAIGAMHSLRAPYFEEYFYPEADTLTAIIYYYNCQWDRVNTTLEETRTRYLPLVERMQVILETDYAPEEWYALLNKSVSAGKDSKDETLIPWIVAKHIERDAKFMRMQLFLRQLEDEAKIFETSASFATSEMGREMTDFALETRDAFLKVIGKYVFTKIRDVTSELNDIVTRAGIISLETKKAEEEWLEEGREIGGRARTVLPRPFVPDDSFQFWWFRGEYWQDELGYFEYKIKTECFDAQQQ